MEAMKRSAGFAESQIRLLLADLKSSSQSARVKAVKRFQDYINTYRPDVYDDDVDLLYMGIYQGNNRILGLLHYCGLDSDKHKNQLKRITKDTIQLLKWLVTLDYYNSQGEEDYQNNIFYERFVHLSLADLRRINFPKHLSNSDSSSNSDRGGSLPDACELISILLADHRAMDTDGGDVRDEIDLMELLEDNNHCKDVFHVWLQKTKADHISKTIEQFKNNKTKAAAKVIRPDNWESVHFTPVPLQEGEEGATEAKVESEEDKIVPDPLGRVDIDLRVTQTLYTTGKISVSKSDSLATSGFLNLKRLGGAKSAGDNDDSDDSSDRNSDSDEDDEVADAANARTRQSRFSIGRASMVGGPSGKGRRDSMSSPGKAPPSPAPTKAVKDSVLPKDKT